MSKQKLYALKGIAFGAGVLIYAVCFAIFTKGAPPNGSESLTAPNEQFIWSTVAIVYIAFFLPLLFNDVTFKNLATQPASLVLLWALDILFCVASLVMSVFVYWRKMETATALIAEGIIVFFALLTILLSLINSEKFKTVGEVKESVEEAKSAIKASVKNKVEEVKSKAAKTTTPEKDIS